MHTSLKFEHSKGLVQVAAAYMLRNDDVSVGISCKDCEGIEMEENSLNWN